MCILAPVSVMFAQAKINVKAGLETWSYKDEKTSVNTSRHPGQSLGVDVLVEKGRGLFVPGFHYHRFSAENEGTAFEVSFKDARHLHYFTIPLLFGYSLTDESALEFSLLLGPEVQFFYNVDDYPSGPDDDLMHGVSTSLTGTVHALLFSFLTAEVRYRHGLQPLIRIREESHVRGWTLAVGIAF